MNQTQEQGTRYATGLRQMPAITWHDDALYIAMNNRDQLDVFWASLFNAKDNAERPAEPLYRAVQGSNFGWPYCFFDYGMKMLVLNPEYGGDGKNVGRCSMFTPPVAAFPAHWAPLAIQFYTGSQFPVKYRNGAFIAFHGSAYRRPMPEDGYFVVFLHFKDGQATEYSTFASGFAGPMQTPTAALHRPTGLAQGPDGALYLADDKGGRIWKIVYRK
jgi:glucose/arabinose dehydrogenase